MEKKYIIKHQIGFRSRKHILLTVFIALMLSSIYIILLKPVDVNALVVANGFIQVLPVSIAKVIVCWLLIGSSFESVIGSKKNNLLSLITGITTATLFFSIYHIGHSAPFYQFEMMLFLLIPGLLTSLFYCIGRFI